ncbi:MAG: FAD:protein FMN transferase [Thiohalomonadales bacterium]
MSIALERSNSYWIGRFNAMASTCELLIEVTQAKLARHVTEMAQSEAMRIEKKFSRYRSDNIVHKINNAKGSTVSVDSETADLLDYAQQCFELSDGLFDITSGVLREAWFFDGSDKIPSQKKVAEVLKYVGWQKLHWSRPKLTMPEKMQIDFGGIGKEYAVDRAAIIVKQFCEASVLLNFGGDLAMTRPRKNNRGWCIGIENPSAIKLTTNERLNIESNNVAIKQFELTQGAVATSGDVKRYLLKDGIRYSHILDPRTGWPMKNAPHSVTVIAETCTDAGIMATLAILHGAQAEEFLDAQEVRYSCVRE